MKPILAGACLFALALPASADLAGSMQQDWLAPRAAGFTRAGAALTPAIQALCDAAPEQAAAALETARGQWLASLSGWERLSGVALGPVLERRSQRQIDFTPTRPRMIEKAIKSAPKTAADMELVGTPAKGLPALEWLLWTQPVQPATPACAYAVQVAAEVGREAAAIAQARYRPSDDQAYLAELVNQWVGGIERLRWAGMEMPVRVARTSGQAVEPDYPRRASGAAAVAWAAQWDALRTLAVARGGSLHAALRARAQDKLADRLAGAVRETDAAMQGLALGDHERILSAARSLAGLKHLVEAEVAPALAVSIGFSDADGD